MVDTNLETMVDEVLDLETEDEIERFVEGHRDLLNKSLVHAIVQRAERALSIDPRRALKMSEVAIRVSSALDPRDLGAIGLRSKAWALGALGRHEEALNLFDRAGQILAALGDELEKARADLGRIEVLRVLGRYDEALSLFHQTAQIFDARGAGDDRAQLNRIAASIYFWQNQFDEALKLLERAEEQFSLAGHELKLAQTRMNKSLVLPCVNKFREAMEANEMARDFFLREGMKRELASAELGAGNIFHYTGHYGHAIDRYREARRIYQELGMDRAVATADTCLANTFLRLGLYQETIDSYRYAQDFYERAGMKYHRALVDLDMGIAHGHLEEFSTAIELLDRARGVFTEMELDDHLAAVELAMAKLSLNRGRRSQALKLALRSAALLSDSEFSMEKVEAQLLVARLHLEEGRPKEAAPLYTKALETVELPWVRHQASYGLGRVARLGENLDEARSHFNRSIEALEQMHLSLRGREKLSLSFMRDKLDVYQEMVSLCLEQGRDEEAFEYVERAKSRTLADLLASKLDAGARAKDAGPEEEIRRLREELNWHYSRLEEETGEADTRSRRDSPLEEINRLERELSELLLHARDARSGWKKIASGLRIDGISPREVQDLLDEESAMIEYYLIGDEVAVFCITPEGYSVHRRVASRNTVENILEKVRFHLAKLSWSRPRERKPWLEFSIRVHLQDLYNALLRPLPGLENRRRLIIIPHDILHFVPFQALHDGEHYVVEKCELSHAPSAGIFNRCRRRRTTAVERILALAVPDDHIPHVVEEVDVIGSFFPQAVILAGEDATEAKLREHAPLSDIIHIASHGVFREDNPLFSRVRLVDGWLTANDVYDLDLRASLVTLSACDTGLNALMGGDELLGMSRGFLYAGAASLIVSLWAVSDESTKRLMEIFYERLQRGEKKSSALRKAQLSLLHGDEGWSHPYYWAPFILTGGGE